MQSAGQVCGDGATRKCEEAAAADGDTLPTVELSCTKVHFVCKRSKSHLHVHVHVHVQYINVYIHVHVHGNTCA